MNSTVYILLSQLCVFYYSTLPADAVEGHQTTQVREAESWALQGEGWWENKQTLTDRYGRRESPHLSNLRIHPALTEWKRIHFHVNTKIQSIKWRKSWRETPINNYNWAIWSNTVKCCILMMINLFSFKYTTQFDLIYWTALIKFTKGSSQTTDVIPDLTVWWHEDNMLM